MLYFCYVVICAFILCDAQFISDLYLRILTVACVIRVPGVCFEECNNLYSGSAA